MLDLPFYIYRHIRPDTNQVFYIGKGNNLDLRKSKYRRAFEKHKRNSRWKFIVEKNNGVFKVEIIYECQTNEEINKKEIEFISLYGRKDLSKGTLINMTDGGDGSLGCPLSEELKAKKRELGSPMQGKKHSLETKKKLSESAKNRTNENPFKGKTHTRETKAILSELAKKAPRKPKTKFINTDTKEIYLGSLEASRAIGVNKATLFKNLRDNYKNNHTPIIYYSDYIKGEKVILKKERTRVEKLCKKVLDKNTGKIYQSVKEASTELGFDVSTLRRRLNGIFQNNTTLEYYGL